MREKPFYYLKIVKPFLTIILLLSVSSATIINIPGDSDSIQGGINLTNTGDTVLVQSGTYNENITYNGKAIVVMSVAGSQLTTIRGSENESVVSFINSEGVDSKLIGFAITNGGGTVDSDPHEYSGQAVFGGGIYIKGASPTVSENDIIYNHLNTCGPNRGAGIAIRDSSNPVITRNNIYNNNTIGPCDWINYFGGGIWIDSTSNPIIGGEEDEGNNIYLNEADNGRALYRVGYGQIINAQYNYFIECPVVDLNKVYPIDQFDVSNCLDSNFIDIKNSHTYVPDYFKLYNYPNPFNPITTIYYDIPNNAHITITIYDLYGREVDVLINEKTPTGAHHIRWDASNDASGVYFYRLETQHQQITKKMILLK